MQEIIVDPRKSTPEEVAGVCFDRVKIGKGVMIMNNCLMMARGGINIDDGAIVTKDVAPNTIVGGNPAKFIKNIK